MTTPQPQPGTAPSTSDPLGLGVITPTGSGKGKDPYGLGALASVNITPGGLFPVRTSGGGTASAQQVLDAFVQGSDPGSIAATQQKLYLGGFYSGTYSPMTHLGLIRPEDIAAMTSAVSVVAQQSAASGRPDASGNSIPATPVDLSQYVNSQAEYGTKDGKQAASVNYETTVHNLVHDDPAKIGLTVDSVAQQILGRKADPAETARIAAFLDRQNIGEQRRLFGAQDSTRSSYVQRQLDAGNPDAVQPTTSAGIEPGSTINDVGLPTLGSNQARKNAAQDLHSQGISTVSTQPTVDDYMQAASAQESGGNYQSVNALSGAQGRFQIMPANWPSWSREAGLGPNAAKTPANQDRVARYKMQQYYDQFGSWDAVAVAWYGGPGAAKAWLRDPNAARFNARQSGGNPSINEYVQQVTSRMGGSPNAQTGLAVAPQYGVQQADIPVSSTVETTNYDPVADTAALLRKNHPVEAGAHDIANTFSTFKSLIGA